jgi:hypothetical protein
LAALIAAVAQLTEVALGTAMTESRTSTILQSCSHVLVVGAGLVYIFGFIIMSIFDAKYGISDFALFRSKVIAVGTMFVFLVGFAVIVTFRTFSIFGLTFDRAPASGITITPENESLLLIATALCMPFICYGFVYPLFFNFAAYPDVAIKGSGVAFLPVVAVILIGVLGRKWFNTRPILFVLAYAINTTSFFIILFKYGNRNMAWFLFWLSMACTFTLVISLSFRSRDEIRKTEWERIVLFIIPAIFGMYAIKVYPNISHQFGGGAPVPIVLHLTKKLPVFDSEDAAVFLIDETEQGYYVLGSSDKALFVARNFVEEVEFLHPEPISPQAVPAKP